MEKAPGPSLFDQKASASAFDQQQQQPVKVVYYRALYPFDARSHDEISITPGDVIMVCSLQKKLLSQMNSAKLTTVSDGHVKDFHTRVLLPVLYLFVFILSEGCVCGCAVCVWLCGVCINVFLSPLLCKLKVKGEWVSSCPPPPAQ